MDKKYLKYLKVVNKFIKKYGRKPNEREKKIILLFLSKSIKKILEKVREYNNGV